MGTASRRRTSSIALSVATVGPLGVKTVVSDGIETA
jgi:hypothetical protein